MSQTQIAFVANGPFAVPLSVAIRSLSRFHDDPVVIVHDDFPPDDRRRVERAAGDLEIRWLEVPEADRSRFPGAEIDQSVWYRLLLPRLLPEATRILYLDADILVTGDLSALLDADLGGMGLGAVQNVRAPDVSSMHGLAAWQHLGLDPGLAYFNAGVLLLDAVMWRDDDLENRSIELAHELAGLDLLPMADQDTLNALFAGAWAQLDYRFNQHPTVVEASGPHHRLLDADALDRLRHDPAIVHFIGRDKPWNATARHPRTAEWRALVSEAAFPDWRPDTRSTTTKITDRLRKASRALIGR